MSNSKLHFPCKGISEPKFFLSEIPKFTSKKFSLVLAFNTVTRPTGLQWRKSIAKNPESLHRCIIEIEIKSQNWWLTDRQPTWWNITLYLKNELKIQIFLNWGERMQNLQFFGAKIIHVILELNCHKNISKPSKNYLNSGYVKSWISSSEAFLTL